MLHILHHDSLFRGFDLLVIFFVKLDIFVIFYHLTLHCGIFNLFILIEPCHFLCFLLLLYDLWYFLYLISGILESIWSVLFLLVILITNLNNSKWTMAVILAAHPVATPAFFFANRSQFGSDINISSQGTELWSFSCLCQWLV